MNFYLEQLKGEHKKVTFTRVNVSISRRDGLTCGKPRPRDAIEELNRGNSEKTTKAVKRCGTLKEVIRMRFCDIKPVVW